MLNISHAKKAQDLATETKYRTFLHEYTTLPSDMNVAWAKKAYGLQSDVSLIVRHPNKSESVRFINYRTVDAIIWHLKGKFVSVFRNSTGQI